MRLFRLITQLTHLAEASDKRQVIERGGGCSCIERSDHTRLIGVVTIIHDAPIMDVDDASTPCWRVQTGAANDRIGQFKPQRGDDRKRLTAVGAKMRRSARPTGASIKS